MCGNHIAKFGQDSVAAGSPPRVREPPLCAPPHHAMPGITPACAGTTAESSANNTSARDHPRVCGNHTASSASPKVMPGSPPRVREPLIDNATISDGYRITPACAGTTEAYPQRKVYHQDHPRVCGNHHIDNCIKGSERGSPPRVREPRPQANFISVHMRITPACAGTTCSLKNRSNQKQDHPRVCGNHPCTHAPSAPS